MGNNHWYRVKYNTTGPATHCNVACVTIKLTFDPATTNVDATSPKVFATSDSNDVLRSDTNSWSSRWCDSTAMRLERPATTKGGLDVREASPANSSILCSGRAADSLWKEMRVNAARTPRLNDEVGDVRRSQRRLSAVSD